MKLLAGDGSVKTIAVAVSLGASDVPLAGDDRGFVASDILLRDDFPSTVVIAVGVGVGVVGFSSLYALASVAFDDVTAVCQVFGVVGDVVLFEAGDLSPGVPYAVGWSLRPTNDGVRGEA